MSLRVAYNIEQASDAVGIDHTIVTIAVREKELPAHRIGNKALILHDDLVAWVRSQPRF